MEDKASTVKEKSGKNRKVSKKEAKLFLENLQELRSSVPALLTENEMLLSCLGRLDPQALGSLTVLDERPGPVGFSQRGGNGRQVTDPIQQLTLAQKMFIVKSEINETKEDHDSLMRKFREHQDNYKASLEEAKLRRAEIVKAKKDMERKLVKRLTEGSLNVKDPEKMLQIIRDKSHENHCDMLRLKNQAMVCQMKELQQQKQRDSELGKIEDDKMKEDEFASDDNGHRSDIDLVELKVKCSKVLRNLNAHRETLQTVTVELDELEKLISNKKLILKKVEDDTKRAQGELAKEEALSKHLRREMEEWYAPDVSEYMEARAKHKQLQTSIRARERKVKIAELGLRLYSKAASVQRNPSVSTAERARPGQEPVPMKLPPIEQTH